MSLVTEPIKALLSVSANETDSSAANAMTVGGVTILAPACFAELAGNLESLPENHPTGNPQHNVDAAQDVAAPEEVNPVSVNAALTPAETNLCRVLETHTGSYEQALMAALALPVPALGAVPAAALRYPVECASVAPEACVCASPVHLQADTENARLFAPESLVITDDEADALMGSINQLLESDGVQFVKASAQQWYVLGMPAEQLTTWPYHALANGKVAAYLPRETATASWRRLMTEVQMLFHEHPVNEQRQRAGKLSINSVWFWGAAAFQNHEEKQPSGTQQPMSNNTTSSAASHTAHQMSYRCFANDSFSNGLAQRIHVPIAPLSDAKALVAQLARSEKAKLVSVVSSASMSTQVVIVDLSVYDAWLAGNSEAFTEAKAQLNEQWVMPLQQAVERGQIREFTLDGCEGHALVETPKPIENEKYSRLTAWLRQLPPKWRG